MNAKLKAVTPLPGLSLRAVFQDGEERIYAVSRLLDEIPAFRAFSIMPGLFEQVAIEPGGYAVVWNDELDLAGEEIYENGRPVAIGSSQATTWKTN